MAFSAITLRKMSLAKLGWKLSAETRAKMSKSHMGHVLSQETKDKIGIANSLKKRTKEQKEHLRIINTGKKIHSEDHKSLLRERMKGNKFAEGVFFSKERLIEMSKSQKGAKHWNWKGGKSSFNHQMRGRMEWRDWRHAVFSRDGYKCMDCGENTTNLEPHHISPIREAPERIFDVNNGITLCRSCHQKTFKKEMELSRVYYSMLIPIEYV